MDPIANLLCCIRNGHLAHKTYVSVPHSQVVWRIAHLLLTHEYIVGLGIRTHIPDYIKHVGPRKKAHATRICIVLKTQEHIGPYVKSLVRVSSPKKRVYLPVHDLKQTMGGFSLRVLSTTQGIMTDVAALQANIGGEVLFACV